MPDLGSLTDALRTLTDNRDTALWFSGGDDSRLLLEALVRTGNQFSVLRFEDGWSREQVRYTDTVLMGKKSVRTYSYPPIQSELAGEGDNFSLASFYPVDNNGAAMILLRDLVEADSPCAFDIKLERPQVRHAPIVFDLHIVGIRFEDTHWLKTSGSLLRERIWKNGKAEFAAPLADWTKDEVRDALKTLEVQQAPIDTGDTKCCFRCIAATEGVVQCPLLGKEIEPWKWDREANTSHIRKILE